MEDSVFEKKECPKCAVEIGEDQTVCPICSYEFPQQKNRIIRIGLILIIIALIYPIYKFLKNIISGF